MKFLDIEIDDFLLLGTAKKIAQALRETFDDDYNPENNEIIANILAIACFKGSCKYLSDWFGVIAYKESSLRAQAFDLYAGGSGLKPLFYLINENKTIDVNKVVEHVGNYYIDMANNVQGFSRISKTMIKEDACDMILSGYSICRSYTTEFASLKTMNKYKVLINTIIKYLSTLLETVIMIKTTSEEQSTDVGGKEKLSSEIPPAITKETLLTEMVEDKPSESIPVTAVTETNISLDSKEGV